MLRRVICSRKGITRMQATLIAAIVVVAAFAAGFYLGVPSGPSVMTTTQTIVATTSAAPSKTETTMATTSAAPLKKVSFILNWIPDASHTGYFVAKEKGLYEQQGLDVDIVPGQGSSYAAKLVAAGGAQFGDPQAPAFLSAVSKDLPLLCVGMEFQSTQSAFFSLASSKIKTPQDWIGKKVGIIPETSGFIEYQALLAHSGIDRKKLVEVPMGFDVVSPLVTRQVDVSNGMLYEYYTFLGKGINVTYVYPPDFGVNMYSTGIVTNLDFAKNNPDVVRGFLRGTIDGWLYAFDHPGEAVDILAKTVPEINRAMELQKLQLFEKLVKTEFTKKEGLFRMEAQRWEQMQEYLYGYGLIKNKVDVSKIFTNEYLP
mgnify:CR=1 FL=1